MARSSGAADALDAIGPGNRQTGTKGTDHWLEGQDIARRQLRRRQPMCRYRYRQSFGSLLATEIKIVTNASTQYNHQTSSICYASSTLGPVHFGLGADTRANVVEVHWPSGIVQRLENVHADQVLKVTEPIDPTPQKK